MSVSPVSTPRPLPLPFLALCAHFHLAWVGRILLCLGFLGLFFLAPQGLLGAVMVDAFLGWTFLLCLGTNLMRLVAPLALVLVGLTGRPWCMPGSASALELDDGHHRAFLQDVNCDGHYWGTCCCSPAYSTSRTTRRSRQPRWLLCGGQGSWGGRGVTTVQADADTDAGSQPPSPAVSCSPLLTFCISMVYLLQLMN